MSCLGRRIYHARLRSAPHWLIRPLVAQGGGVELSYITGKSLEAFRETPLKLNSCKLISLLILKMKTLTTADFYNEIGSLNTSLNKVLGNTKNIIIVF